MSVNNPIARHRVIAGFATLSALLLGILNEMCQRFVESGLLEDRLVFDYVSDVMIVPVIACAWIAARSRIPLTALFGLAAAFSLLEIFGPRDPYDILAYWLSAGIVHGLLNRSAATA